MKPMRTLTIAIALLLCLPVAASAQSIHLLAGMEQAKQQAPVEAKEQAQSQAAPQTVENPGLAPSARSAILMDADSGTIIFEKNSHEKLPPASITKVMTMLLVMEAIADGKLSWEDRVQTSERAASMGGSQIFLEPGEEMTVTEMLKGVALASGNDASVALAEKLAGTEQQFVSLMNQRAAELGLKNTVFQNSNGLPVAGHYSSAHDIAVISRELLKFSEITSYTGMYQDYLRKDSKKPFWLVNTNKLVRFYSGADGLKTGYTSEAKYCLAATARRDDMRIIAVVMGEPNSKTRNAEVSQMLDYAFAQYMNYPLVKAGDSLGELPVAKGEVGKLPITAPHAYSLLLRKGADMNGITYELKLDDGIQAPLRLGQPIGKLQVYQEGNLIKEFDLTSPASVERANWWGLFKRTTSSLFQ